MAKAERLPSGSWRCRVYIGSKKVFDEEKQQYVRKRFYETFTSDDTSLQGRKDVELAAAEFDANKTKQTSSNSNLTVREAIEKYIASSDGILAPSTIHGYNKVLKNGFECIMDKKLKELNAEVLRNAVNLESKRLVGKYKNKTISPKTVRNNYGLITAVINAYYPRASCKVKLPQVENKIKEMPNPLDIINAFRGDRLELAVLLAMWLSFTMSEIRGLTKSGSIYNNDFIVITKVVVRVGKEDKEKSQGKKETRNRMHHIPPYIKTLIDKVDGDVLVPYTSNAIYKHFKNILKKNNIPSISFHDLRHLNASVMALLSVPEKYALERGGWKTDTVMKKVYTHTFSDERNKVDSVIDDYFNKLLEPETLNVSPRTDAETIKMLEEVNTDGRFNALIERLKTEVMS